jgi:outer membrane lipoprotein SlyB
MTQFRHIALLATMFAVAACNADISPDKYSMSAVQQANEVERGIIVGVRQIGVSADTSVGATVGAAAGGVTGSQTGSGVGAALGAIGGTVVGGIVGATTEHGVSDTVAYEYVVQEPKGKLVSVTQKEEKPLPIGQKVLVIAGKQARVVPDYTVEIQTPPDTSASMPKDGSPISLLPPVSLATPGATVVPPGTPTP